MMWRSTSVALVLVFLPAPQWSFAADDVVGVFQADVDGGTQRWTIEGDPKFWKIKISFFDKAGKEIGQGHAATATRNGKNDELKFTVIWDQKPNGNWPDYPHGLMVLDKDKAKFNFEFRKKEICAGDLQRVKK